jgi:hypothetical protein
MNIRDRQIIALRNLKTEWKKLDLRRPAQFILEAFVFAIVFQVVSWVAKI